MYINMYIFMYTYSCIYLFLHMHQKSLHMCIQYTYRRTNIYIMYKYLHVYIGIWICKDIRLQREAATPRPHGGRLQGDANGAAAGRRGHLP